MTRIYVGHIPYEARERDVERFFKEFGIFLMKRGYAFVELADGRDADDAVYDLNGKSMMGMRVVVEIAKGKPRGPGGRFNGRRRSRSRSRSPRRRDRGGSRERSRSRSPRKSRSASRSASPQQERKRDRSDSPPPRKDSRSASPPERNGNGKEQSGSPRSQSRSASRD
ncbi:Serine-arginine protein 55 [Aphelenchoides bicaudatus]|nr:Serine-arginine protein 55 [Aphelenchoides bicaudatus]